LLPPSAKKAILAVDLEAGVAAALAAGLSQWQAEIRLRQVSLAQAAAALQQEVFDLVVVNRGDPETAPAALVAALAAAAPAPRLLLVLGDACAADRPLFQGLGSVEEMPGPASAAELLARIVAALERGVKGHLENVGLAALVQLLALDKESCTLTVQSAMGRGTLYFVRGDLCDAETAAATGEEAAIEVLGWEIANVEMTGSSLRTQRAIEMPVTFLLIEAMRRRDERARGEPGAVAAGARVAAAEGRSNGAAPCRRGMGWCWRCRATSKGWSLRRWWSLPPAPCWKRSARGTISISTGRPPTAASCCAGRWTCRRLASCARRSRTWS